jgi:hypothetical protein
MSWEANVINPVTNLPPPLGKVSRRVNRVMTNGVSEICFNRINYLVLCSLQIAAFSIQ